MQFCAPSTTRFGAAVLFAAGVATLAPLTASAQSNATLFGIIDVFAGKSQMAGRPSLKVANPSALTTSRWGFSGTEDLGEGLKANFYLVALIRPDTGLPGRFDGDAFWSSRSTVGLSGAFGQVNVGRMNSPRFFSLLRYDPHELGGLTPTFLHTYPGGQVLAAPDATPDSTINNGIQYATPNWGGFTGALHASAAETGTKNKGRTGYSLNYATGGLSVGVSGDSIDTQLPAGVTHQSALMVAASYDFQVAKVSGIHQSVKQNGLENTYKIDTFGASVPVGAAKLIFSWARTELDRPVGVDPKRDTYGLTYDYFLSKRTDVYLHGLVDKLTGADRGTSLVAGVRHRF